MIFARSSIIDLTHGSTCGKFPGQFGIQDALGLRDCWSDFVAGKAEWSFSAAQKD